MEENFSIPIFAAFQPYQGVKFIIKKNLLE